jgi:hypothetical protein
MSIIVECYFSGNGGLLLGAVPSPRGRKRGHLLLQTTQQLAEGLDPLRERPFQGPPPGNHFKSYMEPGKKSWGWGRGLSRILVTAD